MKHVLAELHELINDLEDQGLVSEASSLQEVFVRVAEDMEMDDDDSMGEGDDDLAGAVAKLIDENGAAAVLQAVAEAMGGADSGAGDEDGDSETSSFANVIDEGDNDTGDNDTGDDGKASGHWWNDVDAENFHFAPNRASDADMARRRQQIISKYSFEYLKSRTGNPEPFAEGATRDFQNEFGKEAPEITGSEISSGEANFDYEAKKRNFFLKNPGASTE
jgi:hypothetical protein